MKKKVTILIVVIMIISVSVVLYLNKRNTIEIVGNISNENVRYYYVYTELTNGRLTEYLMALTFDNEVVPLLKVKDASYMKQLHINHDLNELYIYNDMVYMINSEGEATQGRNVITYNLKKGRAKINREYELAECGVYLTSEGKLQCIEEVEDYRVNATEIVGEMLIFAYDYNKVASYNCEEQHFDLEKQVAEYLSIIDIKEIDDGVLLVGFTPQKNLLLTAMDKQLNILRQKEFEHYSAVELVRTGEGYLALVDETEQKQEKTLIYINESLDVNVIKTNIHTETLYYSQSKGEAIYYDSKEECYVVLDKKGAEKEHFQVSFCNDKYKYSYGNFYID